MYYLVERERKKEREGGRRMREEEKEGGREEGKKERQASFYELSVVT